MNTSQIALLERRLAREQKARQEAERILEEKSWQLYQANEQLRTLNDTLAQQVRAKIDELQESEIRYRQLIESVQDIIYKISPDGYFTFVNPIVQQYLGYSESELVGRHFIGLVLPEYRTAVIDFYQSMLDRRQSSTYNEFPVRTKDNRIVWIGQTVRLLDGTGNEPELVAVARDITERKLAEDAFHTAQTRLVSLITNLQTGVLVEDENHRVILANQLYCSMFGIDSPPEALTGQEYWQAAAPPAALFTHSEAVTEQMRDAVQRQSAVVDQVVSLVDGRILEWDYIPILMGGQYRGHLWQYTDITEKYRSDERIRKSEEKYRGIMNTMELGLLEVDNEQIIRKAYDRFCRMVGYSEEELIGKQASDLLVPPAYQPFLSNQQEQRLKGKTGCYELPLVRKDGEQIWVLISGAPILDKRGAVQGSMGVHYDITERKRLEEELAQAKQVAEEARYTEKQFLANMSHEIRTPLNAILGFTTLLETTQLDDEQKEFVGFVRTAGKNLLTIVNDILDISKIEAGMLPLESIPFSISSLADSIRTMMQTAAIDKNLRLDVEVDPALPAVVLGDPTRLTQILLNLLSNSIKFTKQGRILVRIENRQQTAEAVRVRFMVQDTGIGMAPDVLPHIFERFRQASDFTTRYYGGTGLGLNIVKSLTEMQGGWVSVESTLGEGSCFTLEIPYKLAPDQVESDGHLSALPMGPDGTGLTILVVEDNPMNQKLALQVLKRFGCTADVAENGQLALEKLQQHDYDLVLMDIQMPVMDGYTTTRHIRQTLRSAIPIVAMTAHALASEREQCLQSGMNDFLPKPFQQEELQRVLRKYVQHIRPREAAPRTEQLPTIAGPGFSLDAVLTAVGDDSAFAAEILSLFLQQTPGELERIRQAHLQNDLATVARIVHTQKVPIQTFGLAELTKLVHELEAQLRAGQGEGGINTSLLINQYVLRLEAELPAIQSALQTLLKQADFNG